MTMTPTKTPPPAGMRKPMTGVSRLLSTLAGLAGVLIGLMSVGVGGATMLGLRDPGYLTLDWLLLYNIALGVLSLGVGAAILFRRVWSPVAALGIAAPHAVVLVVVAVLWASSAAASDSVGAMVFRTVAWLVVAVTAWAALRSKPHLRSLEKRTLR